MNQRLSQSLLEELDKVELPGYRLDTFDHRIVHLGIGAFHRAHQAVYTDTLNKTRDARWSIVGCSLRSANVQEQLTPQNNLYTVLEKGLENKARIIGCIEDVVVGPTAPAAIVNLIADRTTAIVSLTVTEKGYCHFPASGKLNTEHPDIVHDLAHLHEPKSAIGFIVAGLQKRFTQGLAPLTVMSCDNLPHNGKVVCAVVCEFAEQIDPELAAWIRASVAFPCTMVDRIVPATTEEDLRLCETQFGYQDQGLVVAEPFSQWVIEDNFSGPRPDWHKAGALLVEDVDAFETMKLRLLNGSHSLLAYAGYLAGCETVYECMQHANLRRLCQMFMATAAQTLKVPEGFDVDDYQQQLIVRFSNPSLKHRTWQIAMDGSQKVPQRWLGSIHDLLEQQRDTALFAFALAAWMRFTLGVDEAGKEFEVSDPMAQQFKQLHANAGDDARQLVDEFVALEAVFAKTLPAQLKEQVANHLQAIVSEGMNATIAKAVNE